MQFSSKYFLFSQFLTKVYDRTAVLIPQTTIDGRFSTGNWMYLQRSKHFFPAEKFDHIDKNNKHFCNETNTFVAALGISNFRGDGGLSPISSAPVYTPLGLDDVYREYSRSTTKLCVRFETVNAYGTRNPFFFRPYVYYVGHDSCLDFTSRPSVLCRNYV